MATQGTGHSFLPASGAVRINRLTRLFDRTDTSYKFLWFLAILHEFRLGTPLSAGSHHTIKFTSLVKRMFERAHLYTHHYKLRLGHRDKLGEHMASLVRASGKNIGKPTDNLDLQKHRTFWKQIRLNEKAPEFRQMVEYVPRRLLLPFLRADIAGQLRSVKKKALDGEFGRGWRPMADPPLYFYDFTTLSIQVPSEWCHYLSENHTILENWALWNLSCYLSRRNPGVPGIDLKLLPARRSSLRLPNLLWQQVGANHAHALRCIYSDLDLSTTKFVIDHFIPHSFVNHDQPWNLAPTTQQLNSSKSDKLPSMRVDLNRFLDLQEKAISVLQEDQGQLSQLVFAYRYDVFDGEELAAMAKRKDELRNRLAALIRRNHAAARQQGYPEWERRGNVSPPATA